MLLNRGYGEFGTQAVQGEEFPSCLRRYFSPLLAPRCVERHACERHERQAVCWCWTTSSQLRDWTGQQTPPAPDCEKVLIFQCFSEVWNRRFFFCSAQTILTAQLRWMQILNIEISICTEETVVFYTSASVPAFVMSSVSTSWPSGFSVLCLCVFSWGRHTNIRDTEIQFPNSWKTTKLLFCLFRLGTKACFYNFLWNEKSWKLFAIFYVIWCMNFTDLLQHHLEIHTVIKE